MTQIAMKARRKLYTDDERDAAVTRIVDVEKIAAISRETGISAITLKRYVKQRRAGQPVRHQRRETKPTLPKEAEEGIVVWVTTMRRSGFSFGWAEIVQKADEIHHQIHGNTRFVKDLTHG